MSESKIIKPSPSTWMGGLRHLASTLTERAGLASLAGKTFSNKRDLYEALGYKRDLSPEDYRDRFERNGIAARIVEALPNATWWGQSDVVDDEDPEKVTDFEQTWQDLDKRLKIWTKMRRADILAGLGRYGILLIGAPGELDSELPKMKPDEFTTLSVFAEDDVDIKSLIQDPMDSRFGLPEMYGIARLTPSNSVSVERSKTHKRPVHWSRVVHVADGILDDEVYGEPRMKRVWNLLDDLEKVTGGGAETYWLRAHQGYQWDIDKELDVDTDELANLKEQIDEFSHGIRRMVRTRGVTMNALGSDTADNRGPVDTVLNQISSASGIPKRILLGSERGELSSTQDRQNWNDRVDERRLEYAEPMLIRSFVDRLIEVGVLPKPQGGEYEVKWPTMQTLTAGEKADVATKWADLNGKMQETVVTAAEVRETVLELEPLDEDELDTGEPEDDPLPNPAPPPADAIPEDTSGSGQ